MYACVHVPSANGCGDALRELALNFSPAVETTGSDTVVFSIAALRKLLGSPHQIASEICRLVHEHKLKGNLAIASNPDAAILLARNFVGVTLVTPGEERFKLAPLPLACLGRHDDRVHTEALEAFARWGLKSCEDLAALPEPGIAERLGEAGIYLRNLACGKIHRPLRLARAETNYEERMELEHSIDLLEPLLFLLGRVLSELCGRLRTQSRAARALEARFELEGRKVYRCELEFPVTLTGSAAMLKLLQLHLERHPPNAPVAAFTLRVEPAEPRRVQPGFFLPPTPPPDKLQITLARIEGMVGKENERVFAESSDSVEVRLENFPKYVRRQHLTRFLALYEIFKRVTGVKGSVVECGVNRGYGLMSWAKLSALLEPTNLTRRIYGFDTFSGFPAVGDKDRTGPAWETAEPGGLRADSYSELKRLVDLYDQDRFLGHIPKVELVKGDATKTIPAFLADHPQDKYGKHRYTFAATGLDEAAWRERLGPRTLEAWVSAER